MPTANQLPAQPTQAINNTAESAARRHVQPVRADVNKIHTSSTRKSNGSTGANARRDVSNDHAEHALAQVAPSPFVCAPTSQSHAARRETRLQGKVLAQLPYRTTWATAGCSPKIDDVAMARLHVWRGSTCLRSTSRMA